MTQAPTRVVIVDDHPMVAQGIQSILESFDDVNVIATLSDGQQIIDQVEELEPDVILLDLNMPGIGGLSTTEIILERRPEMRILILSMHDSPEYISSALSHGAVGYVLKDVPTDEIKQAIDAVMSGAQYLSSGVEESLSPRSAAREQLTNREQTILLQLARGLSNKEVAIELEISVRTVETHRKNIKKKLGISSTAGLTRYAMEHGVLQGTGVSL
ncbi:MAG: response regulator transcription factor [Pseudomonadota bacterium]